MGGGRFFHGYEVKLRSILGISATRVIHPPLQLIDEHSHKRACLTLPLAGAVAEFNSEGRSLTSGPSAIFHPAGSSHGNEIGEHGLETISLVIDQRFIARAEADQIDRARVWIGGRVGSAARQLSQLWLNAAVDAEELSRATVAFLKFAAVAIPPDRPPWYEDLESVAVSGGVQTQELAEWLAIQPAWLNRAFRATAGEGLREARRRARVESATQLLRSTRIPLAEVAIAAGFCDQSHMNRCFRDVLRRRPPEVRADALRFVDLSDRRSTTA